MQRNTEREDEFMIEKSDTRMLKLKAFYRRKDGCFEQLETYSNRLNKQPTDLSLSKQIQFEMNKYKPVLDLLNLYNEV